MVTIEVTLGRHPARRADVATVDDVARLVRRFYRVAIPDPLLGPIFTGAAVDWGHHIPLLTSFWARELLGEPGYAGNVAGAHVRVLDIMPFGDAQVRRWLELFDETVDELFVGPIADRAKQRAAQVGDVIATLARRSTNRPTEEP